MVRSRGIEIEDERGVATRMKIRDFFAQENKVRLPWVCAGPISLRGGKRQGTVMHSDRVPLRKQ